MLCILCIASLSFLLYGMCIQASDTFSPEFDKKRFWVFFIDKGFSLQDNLDDAIYQYKVQLPPKAHARRQRAPIDISDLPVSQLYIDGVLQLGTTLRITSKWLNGITVEASQSVMPRILQLPYVRAVEPVAVYKRRGRIAPDRKFRGYPYKIQPPGLHHLAPGDQLSAYGMSAAQIQQIHVDALHCRGYHGEGITIAILDTGFDLAHAALRNVRVLAQHDFVNGDGETSDEPPDDDIGQDDHGTAVLSIIAGYSPGNLIGPGYAAEYLLAKTERVSLKGVMFEQEIEEDWWIAGLEWAELNGADVVSSSLGYSDWYAYQNMDGKTAKTTIAANMAVQKGVVMVISAGNEGKSRNWPYISAPADGFDVIAVGAVDYSGELADFSSIGPTYDGRIKPDVVAMGDDTYAVDPNSTDDYRRVDGTSMAAPLVAGTVALLLQALNSPESPAAREGSKVQEFKSSRGSYGPKELAKLLKYTATRASHPDNRYGWGIINAEAAFQYGTSPELMEKINDWDPTGATSRPLRVSFYPNPVKRNAALATIESPELMESIRIFSISGEVVYEKQDMDGARSWTWDLRNQHGHEVASGIYVCIVKSTSGATRVKKVAVLD